MNCMEMNPTSTQPQASTLLDIYRPIKKQKVTFVCIPVRYHFDCQKEFKRLVV